MPRFALPSLAVPLFSLMFVVGGCAMEPRVTTQPTPGTDFSKYRTYAIKPGNIAYPGMAEAPRAEVARRIQDAIARSLESRGLAPQPDEPDLVVTYTAGARQAGGPTGRAGHAPTGVDIRGPGGTGYDEPGMVQPREWDDPAAEYEARSGGSGNGYSEGTVVIDLLDGNSRKLVWRARAEMEVASPRGARMIDSVVDRAFSEVSLGM
jgi:hypothetical protein